MTTPDPTAILRRWLAPRVLMDPGAAAAEVMTALAEGGFEVREVGAAEPAADIERKALPWSADSAMREMWRQLDTSVTNGEMMVFFKKHLALAHEAALPIAVKAEAERDAALADIARLRGENAGLREALKAADNSLRLHVERIAHPESPAMTAIHQVRAALATSAPVTCGEGGAR